MKNILVVFLAAIMLFIVSCISPPNKAKADQAKPQVTQVIDNPVQATVMFAVDDVTPVAPAPATGWLDNNLIGAISGVVLAVYELLVRLIPTSKSISIVGWIYKLINLFIPDKSATGGSFDIKAPS